MPAFNATDKGRTKQTASLSCLAALTRSGIVTFKELCKERHQEAAESPRTRDAAAKPNRKQDSSHKAHYVNSLSCLAFARAKVIDIQLLYGHTVVNTAAV